VPCAAGAGGDYSKKTVMANAFVRQGRDCGGLRNFLSCQGLAESSDNSFRFFRDLSENSLKTRHNP
jgi:hypothetical protein